MVRFLRKLAWWRRPKRPQVNWGIEVPYTDCPACPSPGYGLGINPDTARQYVSNRTAQEIADELYREYGYESSDLHWRSALE